MACGPPASRTEDREGTSDAAKDDFDSSGLQDAIEIVLPEGLGAGRSKPLVWNRRLAVRLGQGLWNRAEKKRDPAIAKGVGEDQELKSRTGGCCDYRGVMEHCRLGMERSNGVNETKDTVCL